MGGVKDEPQAEAANFTNTTYVMQDCDYNKD